MRKIDRVKPEKSRPTRLLVLGISRTGTTSLCQALDKFNYKIFHMNECIARPSHVFPLFTEAIHAKYNNDGAPYGKSDFDKIYSEYDAVSDMPSILFSKELLEAYPDAKVILTTRDAEKWVDSMQASIWLAHSWWTWDYLTPFMSVIRGWRRTEVLAWDAFINSSANMASIYPTRRDYLSKEFRELAIRRFNEHNEYIRSIVPKERLLVFPAQDGWGPLCEFLGEEGPDSPYPRTWDKNELAKQAALMWWAGVAAAVLQIGGPVVVAVGVWRARKSGWW